MLTTLPLSRSTPPAEGGPSRQLYMQLREVPDRAAANVYLQRRLAEAAALTTAWGGGLPGLEEWLEARTRARADALRQYQAARQGGAPRRHFATLAQARRFLCVQAPSLLAEGAWLHSLLDHWRQPAYMPVVKLYLDYLGNGVPADNRVAQARQALAVQACGNWQELDDANFVQGAIRLALASSGERFLPEVLGYQLAAPEYPTAHPGVLQELAELGIRIAAPPASDHALLATLRSLLRIVPEPQSFLARVELGQALARIGLQTLPTTPESGAAQDAPVTSLPSGALASAAPDASIKQEPAPRAILRHDFPADEHAWETITNDLGLLEAQIANCSSKGEAMTMLARHMGPAVHHQPLGLMATRVYSQLFALT